MGSRRKRCVTPELFNDLRADYTRLLAGTERVLAPPWESVYYSESRLVFHEQTMQVRLWYQQFGLEVAQPYHEPDDHIALEFAFIAHLALAALTALDQDDTATFEQMMTAQHDFLERHLLDWLPEWSELIQAHAKTDFFRGIALFAKGVAAEISTTLSVTLPVH